ncbi:MAG: YggT family protein [Gammaproteobacteria bacterium]
MSNNYLANPLILLLEVGLGLYIMTFMLRYLLAMIHADFYNPVSQFLVKVTDPLLVPARRFIPSFGKIDSASIVIMLSLQILMIFLVYSLRGTAPSIIGIVIRSIADLLELFLNIFLYSILIQVIISWINPGNYNPVTSLLSSLTEPLLRPARQLIKPIGGMDLSPMAVMISITIVKMLLLPPLYMLAGI